VYGPSLQCTANLYSLLKPSFLVQPFATEKSTFHSVSNQYRLEDVWKSYFQILNVCVHLWEYES
jgi:hypothetical protein